MGLLPLGLAHVTSSLVGKADLLWQLLSCHALSPSCRNEGHPNTHSGATADVSAAPHKPQLEGNGIETEALDLLEPVNLMWVLRQHVKVIKIEQKYSTREWKE